VAYGNYLARSKVYWRCLIAFYFNCDYLLP